MNPFDLMKNMQNIQAQMQQMQSKLEHMRASGSAGAGMVEVTVNGRWRSNPSYRQRSSIPSDVSTLRSRYGIRYFNAAGQGRGRNA